MFALSVTHKCIAYVFWKFSIKNFKDFNELQEKIQSSVAAGSGDIGQVRRAGAKVTWSGLQVLLCEIRVAATKFGWVQLADITTTVSEAPKDVSDVLYG